jgi:hypothetical protein
MKFISEMITEGVEPVVEGTGSNKKYYLDGIYLQGNLKNKNGRIYPIDILESAVSSYHEKYITPRTAWGELGHPSGPKINPERISHRITKLVREGDNFIGRSIVTDTPYGNIVKGLMESGGKLGVSSRGFASLNERNDVKYVCDDLVFATAADIVVDPSAPDAFVDAIMEESEWVWKNGIIAESKISEIRDNIKNATKRHLVETKIKQLEKFLSLLSSKA